MRIIVTGGAGFIGSNLVNKLVSSNNKVIVIDNLSTGYLKNLQKSLNKILFIKHDLSKPLTKKILKSITLNIDIIFHLAALPRVTRSLENPLETHESNVNGTLNILQLARDLKVKKFVYTSSSSVYGDHPRKDLPLTEDATTDPVNPYATQKLIGEQYCRVYSKVFKLTTFCMRLFNVYGPGMDLKGAYKLVFGNWIEQMKLGKKLTVYGDGNQTRDFTHIDDVIKALILVMKDKNKLGNFIFNVCSGRETSINHLAMLFNHHVEYIKNPRPQEERYKQGSFKKIQTGLSWKPEVSLEKGIKEFIYLSKNSPP